MKQESSIQDKQTHTENLFAINPDMVLSDEVVLSRVWSQSIRVYDNFFLRPDEIRARAMASEFVSEDGDESNLFSTFPGTWSEINPPADLIGFMEQQFDVEFEEFVSRFQLTPHESQKGSRIHVDFKYKKTSFALLVFLSDEPSKPGTSFFQHKDTEILLTSRPWMEAVAAHRKCSRNQVLRELMNDGVNPELWDLFYETKNIFNRAILYPSGLIFHNAAFWGSDPGSARLILSNVGSVPESGY